MRRLKITRDGWTDGDRRRPAVVFVVVVVVVAVAVVVVVVVVVVGANKVYELAADIKRQRH